MLERVNGRICFCSEVNIFHRWESKRWVQDTDDEAAGHNAPKPKGQKKNPSSNLTTPNHPTSLHNSSFMGIIEVNATFNLRRGKRREKVNRSGSRR